MSAIQDPSKKTSINSLLNPQVASAAAFPAHLPNINASVYSNQQQSHDHHQTAMYGSSYTGSASFNLRAASWDLADDSSKRKGESSAHSSGHYSHSHMSAPPMYPEGNIQRVIRTRPDVQSSYAIDGKGWHPHQDVPYGPSVAAPMYSQERTVLPGDSYHNSNYPHPFSAQTSPAEMQVSERASVRLAARESQQDPRFPPPQYYAQPNPVYNNQPEPHSSQQLPPIQPPTLKRPVPDKTASAPATKRAKSSKPKTNASEGTVGPSKRGYNSRKRIEAAQIAAQNAQLMPSVSYTQMPTEKGKEKASDARMIVSNENSNGGTGGEGSMSLHPELQFARCMSNRYRSDQFPRCVSCTRRWAGDTCRFQGIRFFLKDHDRNIRGISFVESQKADAPTMNFPTRWNIALRAEHIKRTKLTIARALLPTLHQELKHLSVPEIIRRPRENEVRATCDTCMTSIFSSSWMCRLCGREACAECYAQVRELTVDTPGVSQEEYMAIIERREKHAHSNPFFLSCTRRNEHQANDFSAMSRFCFKELEETIAAMEKVVEENDAKTNEDRLDESSAADSQRNKDTKGTDGNSTGSRDDLTVSGNASPPFEPTNLSQVTLETPSLTIRRFADADLTTEVFAKEWTRGEPLVVTGLMSKFKIQWTPEYFVKTYGEQSCLIIECQTDVNKRVTIGEFFGWFGNYTDRTECWKLKDWPPSTDFKTTFPELYEDFSRAVPVPDYVRRDGVYNVGSHFPSNTIGPDLGPKMYNAMASTLGSGSKGSTRLHMDMADALNIMTYAAPCADGSLGCAAWDLFRSEDSDKLRGFLRKKFGGGQIHDPVHSQQFYLHEDLRKELYNDWGVKSYRVYQRPGEAIFIPAGCAHQVANLSDCVKVAIDFVSPENIERCEKLTREFREQNQSMMWKEDVLQLRTMMWFAWLSCCQQEKRMNEG